MPCLTKIIIIVSWNESVNTWIFGQAKWISFPKFMLLNIRCSLATFGSTPKVNTKATMNKKNEKKKSWCTMPPLAKEKQKQNKIKIWLKESQVVLYVDQRNYVK